MTWSLLLLTVANLLTAVLCARTVLRLARQTRIAHARAAEALQRLAAEETEKETALGCLAEAQHARGLEAVQYAARVQAIRTTADATIAEYQLLIRTYRQALALDDVDDPPTTH